MTRVLLLPGAVLPAGPAYAALLPALGDQVEAVAEDLELYAASGTPTDNPAAPGRAPAAGEVPARPVGDSLRFRPVVGPPQEHGPPARR